MATAASPASVGAPSAGPVTKYRLQYEPTPFVVSSVHLDFALEPEATVVTQTTHYKPNDKFKGASKDMLFDGAAPDDLKLVSICVNDADITAQCDRHAKGLTVPASSLPDADEFVVKIVTEIAPAKNTALEGLYQSSGNFCSQCEAEGFRRITFYYDRPDVMTKFTVRMDADKEKYPVLLSNGNLVESGDVAGTSGRHYAVYEDPWAKPCYLFALVAGNLKCVEETYTTKMSGKKVTLRIYVEEHNLDKCQHAMDSLIRSMEWDEEKFGLEYDLEIFNIVAVDDFNMGAMENKSLNVFNSRLVLATPRLATDGDFYRIEGVVGHEYFHNWTGNRVTCKSWFELSLKEGLTVYRDQEFSADVNSRAVKRIDDATMLRAAQFAEDAGPIAHPIRPDSYQKMDNFYTVTVYEKGAEVVRMYERLLGKDGFRKGMDLYFKRHDGCAVTCNDFYQAMVDAANGGNDLPNFLNWYAQAGTPAVTCSSSYDEAAKTYALTLKQTTPSTPGQPSESKKPLMIPVATSLLDSSTGAPMPSVTVSTDGGDATTMEGPEFVLRFHEAETTYTFSNVASKPVPSLFRGFSAPVKVTVDGQSMDELAFLIANDTDGFVRYDASQRLARTAMNACMDAIPEDVAPCDCVPSGELASSPSVSQYLDAISTAIDRVVAMAPSGIDEDTLSFIARLVVPPAASEIITDVPMGTADPAKVCRAREAVLNATAQRNKDSFAKLLAYVDSNEPKEYKPDPTSMALRTLKSVCLKMGVRAATVAGDAAASEAVYNDVLERYRASTNMTTQIACMSALNDLKKCPAREAVMEEFYNTYKEEKLVMFKWLSMQASSGCTGADTMEKVFEEHPAYNINNPNSNYSLLGGFCGNLSQFHTPEGYAWVAKMVKKLDTINPQVASRFCKVFARYRQYEPTRQALMKGYLEELSKIESLSENSREIVTLALNDQ